MRMISRARLAATGVVFAALALRPGQAAAQSFAVSADVVQGCAINSSTQATGVDFGKIDFGTYPAVGGGTAAASALLAGSPVQVQCTASMTMHVAVDAGTHVSGSVRQLALSSGAGRISYRLYTTAARTTEIPTSGFVNVVIPASGALTLPIYGVATLPASGIAPGIYTDSLQVTLSW